MKYYFSIFVLFFFLASCAPAQKVAALPQATDTATVVVPTLTATLAPAPTSASTPIPCDPRVEDYCITEGHFLFQRPIFPPANDSVDKSYRFASTANGTRDPHHGVEFLNKFGTPVHAAADGIVVITQFDAFPADCQPALPGLEGFFRQQGAQHERKLDIQPDWITPAAGRTIDQATDQFGHLAGSGTLTEVGGILAQGVRESDILARYGGDEFVVVLPETPASGALVIAERLRRAIEEHRFLEAQGISARISASFGIATYPDHALSPEGLIQKADQAMYRVKEREKNGIEVAG